MKSLNWYDRVAEPLYWHGQRQWGDIAPIAWCTVQGRLWGQVGDYSYRMDSYRPV